MQTNASPRRHGLSSNACSGSRTGRGHRRLRLADSFYIYNLSTASWARISGARFRVTMRVQKAGHVDTLCDVYLINK